MAKGAARGVNGSSTNGVVGTDQYPDLETELEQEMSASGRSGVVPRSGLVGAHQQRHGSLAAALEVDEPGEPAGAGADVAPTARAEQREKRRHELERALGVEAAGDASLRQRRGGASRAALDDAGSEADRLIAEQVAAGEDPNNPEREHGPLAELAFTERATLWLRNHPLPVALGAAVVVGAACVLVSRRS